MSTPPNPPDSPTGPPTEPAGTPIPEAAAPPGPSPTDSPGAAPASGPSLSKSPAPEPSPAKEPAPADAPIPGPSLAKEPSPTPGPSLAKEPASADAPPAPVPTVPAAPAAPPAPAPPTTPSGFAPLTPGPPAGAFGAPAPGPQTSAEPANPWSAPADQGFAGPPPAGPGGYAGPPGYGVPPGPPGYPGYPGYPGAVQEKGNGLAVASLVLGLVAVLVALTPFFFWIGTLIGLTGLGLGIAAMVSASRGAPRKAMSLWGTILGVLSLFASVAGFYFTVKVADEVDKVVDSRPSRSWDTPYIDPSPYPKPSFSSPYDFPGDEPATGPGFSTPLAFGQSHTYANGLKVSLSAPVEYVSESGFADVDNAVRFDITITNTSKKTVTVFYAQPDVTDEQGRAAESVFDGHMPKTIAGAVAPGATATGSAAYEVPKGARTIRAEISPGLLLDPVKFAGPIR
ncbi:DUF4352 domain-containing protein [Streptomyces sp. NPDC051577]|uniref:DUF4352 domain-containing protein n=1 Tax=Streptomyces sp. NPDC051577 TaxID=3155166 RepID=UPI003435E578